MAVLINPGLMPVTLIPARAYSIAKLCATFLIVASAKSPRYYEGLSHDRSTRQNILAS
jgi:hypothetical protein